ncbi:cupin domain-containing protein [Streptomyces sp. ok210]|uniref:cupin domain-containing protein n=1 Tax=Streptomyces sp. ok210 TaxID=1761905 RepID=UPI000D1B6EDF|nr:cupin domain-containing protein [Streptomyces sp. ok210]
MRLVLGEKDLQVRVGESAEFSTRLPHWFGNNCQEPAEAICLFGRQGEQIRPVVTPSTAGQSPAAATLPSTDTLYSQG